MAGPGLRRQQQGRSGPGSPDLFRTSFPDQPDGYPRPLRNARATARNRSICRFVALVLLLQLGFGATCDAAPPGPKGAALALVFATDVSSSVTPDTYLLQMDGIARAVEDRRVLDALAAASGGVEVMLLQWSNPRDAIVSVPWTRVTDAASARRFAGRVRRARRSSRGLTAIGAAILAATRQFDSLPLPAARRIIDVSGDGMANFGIAPDLARDAAVKSGITINGLAVLIHEPWLESYYRRRVIGGPAAFVLAAQSPSSFADAMRRKLTLEIAGVPPKLAQMQ
jgi:Protein of unknown function (DUF1194)